MRGISEQVRLQNQHAAVLDRATGLRRAILELHAPRGAWPECHGCPHGYEEDSAEWPCDTYRLAIDIDIWWEEAPVGSSLTTNLTTGERAVWPPCPPVTPAEFLRGAES